MAPGKRSLLICFPILCIILLHSRPVLAQQKPVFACDMTDNPELKNFRFCDPSLGLKTRVDDLWWSEALHGVSYGGPGTKFSSPIPAATIFPQVILTASTFNDSLFEAIAKVVSTEARAMYNVGLAGLTFFSPNINIFRDPRWGRGQETPGEDPLLSSNYGAVITPEEAAALAMNSGVDLNCGSFLSNHAQAAVDRGLLSVTVIDRAVSNNFATLMRLGFFDGDPSKQLYGNLGPEDAIKSLAVIGPNANATHTMLGDYEGVPCKYTSPLQSLTASVPTVYQPGCADVLCGTAQIEDAKKIASTADAVVIIVGSDLSIETETVDRVNITLPGQQQTLVTEVAEVSKGPVILVIMSGGSMDVQFAKKYKNYQHSLGWLPWRSRWSSNCRCGRLTMTWYPQSFVEKVEMTDMNMRSDPARGFPGRTYRFYDGPTVFNFGDGLSYSQFNHQLVTAPTHVSIPLEEGHVCQSSTCRSINPVEQSCKNSSIDIHLRVKNVGNYSGSHTVLLFSSPPQVHNAPRKQLIGYQKLHLTPQAEGLIGFNIDVCKHLSIVDENGNQKVALGEYILHIGSLMHSLHVVI
ncbi:UNVERIFIED_CONTAM: Beta-xylosidase/alpha-L-arabinofuranosidase 1 [Sesamum calycinum]|uniref:Beta-xylosidase/alpha-L-arabinofuranosidase 1 n=1 Tax=Sesamum calycinum TaxID=2727403 RepID=A0AAW2PRE9_9LAMI